MKRVQFKGEKDLTTINISIFNEGLNEIRNRNKIHKSIQENKEKPQFDSIESYLDYYDAIPFDEFDKKFTGKQ